MRHYLNNVVMAGIALGCVVLGRAIRRAKWPTRRW
jgi:hypothetical protein